MVDAPPLRSPSSDPTRQALIEAATTVFAERGFAAGSVRAITRLAGANQAAITYHFGGKDELYRAVLRAAVAAFEDQSLIDEHAAETLDRVEALRLVMRQFLVAFVQQDRLGRYVQIFGWEGVNPSAVYSAFFAEETPQVFKAVMRLVGRFLPPDARPEDASVITFWLTQQPIAFVRNAARLRNPPHALTFDAAGVERLVDLLTDLSLSGLSGRASKPDQPPIGNGR